MQEEEEGPRQFLERFLNNGGAKPIEKNGLLRSRTRNNECPRQFLERFLNLKNHISELSSCCNAKYFVRDVVSGSLIQEEFVKTATYDMGKIIARAEEIFCVIKN